METTQERLAPYRSNKSVPDRVDRAWGQGYEAGKADGKRIAIVALAITAFTLWRHPSVRGHSHLIPWALVGSLVALTLVLCAVPFVLGTLGIRAGVRHHRANKRRRPTTPVVYSPGEQPF
jgi:hypothetical protein